MSCPRCPCDECYLEHAPVYGPTAPSRCYRCLVVIGYPYTWSAWCSNCINVFNRRLAKLRKNHKPLPANDITHEEYQRMMQEAQGD